MDGEKRYRRKAGEDAALLSKEVRPIILSFKLIFERTSPCKQESRGLFSSFFVHIRAVNEQVYYITSAIPC